MKNEMNQIFSQFFVFQKFVKRFILEGSIDFLLGLEVDAEADELHQDSFLDDGDVLRCEHVRSKRIE
jgi:hypothetical protein